MDTYISREGEREREPAHTRGRALVAGGEGGGKEEGGEGSARACQREIGKKGKHASGIERPSPTHTNRQANRHTHVYTPVPRSILRMA